MHCLLTPRAVTRACVHRQPSWAEEILKMFRVGPPDAIASGSAPTMSSLVTYKQIHKGSKKGHLREIATASGVALSEMVFFDDQRGNIKDVSSVGVLSILTPNGVEAAHWTQCLDQFHSRSTI
jgi:magnesium-dependent phosphatase-1